MKKILPWCGLLLLAACATPDTGPVPGEHGTYVLQRKSDGVGYGQLEGLKQKTYAEARDYCAGSGLVMQPVQYNELDGKLGRVSGVLLVFECVPRAS